MPDLSIVIVNYNTREPLRRCLESILAHGGTLDLEVIVVDNASKDDSAAMVRQVMPQAKVIEPGRNTWFTGGNNIGLQQVTAERVLILNPDTVFQPQTLQTMLAYMQAHPEVGALTCQMRFPDGGVQPTGSLVPGYVDLLFGYTFLGVLFRPWRDARRKRMWFEGWQRDTSRAVEVIPDSNLMAPTALLRQIGCFDETMKLYFTEDDLCRRILQSGHQVYFLAEALLLHEEHASTKLVQRLASQVYFQDLLVFSRKYYGAPATLVLQALIWPTRHLMDLAQLLRGERQSL
jgi:GT2 family glycosyltransferase